MTTEPQDCPHCGHPLPVWADIVPILEKLASIEDKGVKPILTQAIQEIERFRQFISVYDEWITFGNAVNQQPFAQMKRLRAELPIPK